MFSFSKPVKQDGDRIINSEPNNKYLKSNCDEDKVKSNILDQNEKPLIQEMLSSFSNDSKSVSSKSLLLDQ